MLGSRPPPLYLFIDALDECDESERHDVVIFLEKLMQQARSNDVCLKVLLSSRPFPEIDIEACEEIKPEDHNGRDIFTYVEQRLARLPNQKDVSMLRTEILQKARGVFLWVVLVLDILTKNKYESVEEWRGHLLRIPPGLTKLYGYILDGITDKERERMLHMVQWVLFAYCPFEPQELLTAMAFDQENRYTSFKAWQDSSHYMNDEAQIDGLIRSWSRGMIEVKRSQPHYTWGKASEEVFVQFIHESAREYFLCGREGGMVLLAPDLEGRFAGSSHDRLARSCASFLRIEESRTNYWRDVPEAASLVYAKIIYPDGVPENSVIDQLGPIQHVKELPEHNVLLSFRRYALQRVFDHAQDAESNGMEQKHLVDVFCRNHGEILENWVVLHKALLSSVKEPGPALLDDVLGYKLPSCVEVMLQTGKDTIRVSDDVLRDPLIVIAEYGHVEVVRQLLAFKVDTEARDASVKTVLQWAIYKGQGAVVRVLLDDEKMKTNAANINRWKPLHLAVAGGRIEMVQLVLACGADIEAQNSKGETALQLAMALKHKDMNNLEQTSRTGKYEEIIQLLRARANESGIPLSSLLLPPGANNLSDSNGSNGSEAIS